MFSKLDVRRKSIVTFADNRKIVVRYLVNQAADLCSVLVVFTAPQTATNTTDRLQTDARQSPAFSPPGCATSRLRPANQ